VTHQTPVPDTAQLLRLAEEVAREAGRLIVEGRPASLRVSSKSTDTDPVTEMDRAAERLLVERITAARPLDGFLGEEGASVVGTSGVTWVIDPIDGTVNYLYSIPTYAVSVGVRVGDEVVAGAVVNPVSGEVWTARRGHGAHLNGRPIAVNEAVDLAMALVGTGFGYDADRRAQQADVLRQVVTRVRDVRRAGSAALDLCAVATGRLDAYYEQGLNPWDIAAGGLIATEAGAIVGGLRGRDPGADMVLAAPAGVFAPLDQMLAALDADRS
jgi:myo-inositol-1(or 4)-monophosphatase